jgi:hypothetical protein
MVPLAQIKDYSASAYLMQLYITVLRRIHMLLGLPNPHPDPLDRGMDPDPAPDPDPSIIMQK